MRRILIVIIVLFCAGSLNAQEVETSGNPVFDGWYADPEGTVFGDQYWIFPTFSAPYEEQVFMDAFSSPDLINWEKHERIIDTAAVAWADSAMWAPSITKKGDQYFLFFAANDIQEDEQVGGIGIGVSDEPGGPYEDYLGEPLLSKFHNGAQPIDQFVFEDKDGQYYMIYGGWGHCNIPNSMMILRVLSLSRMVPYLKRLLPKAMWRDHLCLPEMINITLCGRKADGAVPTIAWPMP